MTTLLWVEEVDGDAKTVVEGEEDEEDEKEEEEVEDSDKEEEDDDDEEGDIYMNYETNGGVAINTSQAYTF